MSTVLISYEREFDLEAIRKLLESRGHGVATSSNGIDALEAARKEPPDLIVSDVLLPKMDGFALCRKCKQDERLQSVPFIFHPLRRNDPKYERFAIEAGAERFIARHGDSDGLLRVIDELLQSEGAKKNLRRQANQEAERQAVQAQTEARATEMAQAERAKLQAELVELQHAKERLAAGEQRFRQLFEANPVPMWLIDSATGNFSAVNDPALQLLGYSRTEFLALKPKAIAAAAETPDIQVDQLVWLQPREGRRIAAIQATQELDFEERRVQLIAITDISERIDAEHVLAERAEMYRSALAAAPCGYWLLDNDGRVLDANQAYCQISGYARQELLQMNVTHLELDVLAETTVRLHIKAGTGAHRYQAKHRRKDGQLIDVEVDAQRIDGESSHRVAFIRDISRRSVELSQHALQKLQTESLLQLLQRADSLEESALLQALVEQAARRSESAFAGLYVADAETSQLRLAAVYDVAQALGQQKSERPVLNDGRLWEQALRSGQPVCNNDPQNTIALSGVPPLHRHIAIPLEDDVAVALLVIANRERDYAPENIADLQQVAGTVWGIARAKRRHARTLASLQRSEVAVESMIETLGALIENHDPHSAANCRRVSALAAALGRELNLDDSQQQSLRIAGLLHDVGVIAVPAEIWSKPRALGAAEIALMRTHAEQGAKLLAKIDFGLPVAEIVHQHHERMDGSGYPRRLKGDEILLEARILAVADSMEAMCAPRAHRAEMNLRAALDALAREAGKLYDEKIVAACIKLFNERGFRLPA